MRRIVLSAVALIATLMSLAAVSDDRPAVPADETLLREIAAIRVALERLSRQIEALTAQQELDVLVRRIQVKQDRMIPIEAELREARNEDRRLAQEMEKIELLESQWQDEVTDHRKLGEDAATEETERQLALLRQRRETLDSRAMASRQRVIELENSLADTRSEIEAAEALVDEQLQRR